jgi:hypothetical protein
MTSYFIIKKAPPVQATRIVPLKIKKEDNSSSENAILLLQKMMRYWAFLPRLAASWRTQLKPTFQIKLPQRQFPL